MSAPFQLDLFRNRDRARRDLEEVRSRVPAGLFSALLVLLGESSNPDQALNLFERLAAGPGDELIRLLDRNRVLLHYVLAIFASSYWLGDGILRHPEIFHALQREKNLERSLGREDYRENLARFRSRSVETDISTLLAAFKKREYVRIALRDLLGIATLAETTAEISALADVILEAALRATESRMRERFGSPQYPDAAGRLSEAPFAVVSLGKLGGNELNYSSDLDLLYLFGGGPVEQRVHLDEYFTRQAQLLTDLLCRSTREGAVFRVDLRLRPQGGEGQLAVSVQRALDYYAGAAHDWELQALIKARHAAGDPALSGQFIQGVQRHVYKKDVNFAAIETALHSREKMSAAQLRSSGRGHASGIDVKLDRGGIRDIEFLVQCLQRVYGGEEKWLRSGGTLFSLQKLHDKGHISGKDFHDLTLAYEFLRRVEHRLQLQRGQQVHRLPADSDEMNGLGRSLEQGSAGDGFVRALEAQMGRVAEIYERIIHRHRRRERQTESSSEYRPETGSVREMSFEQVLERLAQDSPAIYKLAARKGMELHTRRSLHRFLSSAMTSADRYAAVLKKPAALERAMALFATSDYLTDILVRHPDSIRALDPDEPGRLAAGLLLPDRPARSSSGADEGAVAMEMPGELRRSYRKAVFAAGARDILAPRPAFESMQETSHVADAAIRVALRTSDGERTLAVFALGRLGTEEFDIASDADLLFVRAPEIDPEPARAAAAQLVHALAAYTRDGAIFAVDARLRPHGNEGELVVAPAQLERYLADEAQPWEALTYTKLRFVAGREDLAPSTLKSVRQRIVEMAARLGFNRAVAEMRERLEKSNRYANSFKLARGGFYDIDFIASYLMLREASLVSGNILERLQHLQQAGALDAAAAGELQKAAILYRTTDHVIRLVTGRARPELPEAEHARAAVEGLVHRILQRAPDGLQAELSRTALTVREIFARSIR
ncbi:MAG TPA: hypothetical protein VLT57_18850 [Bryobacteraceae bacterium]|nr:hypothetical protein [Bryobacteraceae bacterium]